MSSFRSVFVALLVSALVSLVLGQGTTITEPTGCTGQFDGCNEVEVVTTNPNVFLNLRLTFIAATNTICSLTNPSGDNSVISGNGFSTGVTLDTTQGRSFVVPAADERSLTQFTVFFVDGAGNHGSAIITGTNTILSGGGSLTYLPYGANAAQVNPSTSNACTGILGDPLFSGFKGQQFYVEGKDGQVMNMLSTFNMQLNGRFVMLQEGEALYPYQQEKLQLESQIAHQSAPSVAAFPKTTAWSHPGNYIGEAGVALLGDNRVYAKAGAFATGFSKLTLNGRNMPVADEIVVLGSGVNTTFVQRVSAHEMMVRTVNVEFTIINSDNFLNIERIHMERGAKQFNHFDGLLGKTADSKWSYSPAEEQAAVVQSDNLFERTAVQA